MKTKKISFDLVVVGGGHAGTEAAHAAARLGLDVALATHAVEEIGRMPCNPAIGGLGKGHLVCEIDALGGLMGRVIDRTGIQFRILNRRKGPAVQSPRAQADKTRYQEAMTEAMIAASGITVLADEATGLIVEDGAVAGVRLRWAGEVTTRAVVLCSGTFLRGLMHTGDESRSGGREGADAVHELGEGLEALGLTLNRLKTGTPPRLHADSIDYEQLKPQDGDADPQPFSLFTDDFAPTQIRCWQGATHAGTHELIRGGLDRSPLYGGIVQGRGPRYCPSIEDKVVRFPGRASHTVFLEPEGLDTPEVYVNGLSTSLPADLQEAVVRSVPGLERARFLRYGYAVEYDSVPSWQVERSLQTKAVGGLYLAGQILGTSGYEEAAAQGLIAGANAARALQGLEPVVPARRDSYLGVLVDDLVTKEITEPYRMFTSRAEARLSLRCDNVATRLLPLAETLGLLDDTELERLRERTEAVRGMVALLGGTKLRGPDGGALGTWLKRPDASLEQVPGMHEVLNACAPDMDERGRRAARFEAEIGLKYEGYIRRQDRQLREQDHLEALEIPADFDYDLCTQLSTEAREKLSLLRPPTLGVASRIDGVRSADLAILSVLVRRGLEA